MRECELCSRRLRCMATVLAAERGKYCSRDWRSWYFLKMSGCRGAGRERRPRGVSQKRKAEADLEPEIEVKTELEDEGFVHVKSNKPLGKSDVKLELETRWEWLDDGDMWTVYTPELNEQINLAFSSGKQSVTVSPVAGVSLQVDLRRMVQKNTKSGYKRLIRLAVKEQDQYFVWQWQSDEGSWVSYDANTCILLETALHADSKLVSLSLGGRPYTVDLGAMLQINSQTQHEREIQRCLSVASDAWTSQQKQSVTNGSTAAKRARSNRNTGSRESEAEESKEQVRTLLLKGKAPVDPECSSKLGKAHVFCEGDDVYDIMLNQEGTTRYLEQHSLGEEYHQQDHCQQPHLQFHSWHSIPDYINEHHDQVTVSCLPSSDLLENAAPNIRQLPDYTHIVTVSAGREVDHAEVHTSCPQRKSTVWDFFHLKDPSIGIRNATSAFCNLCTREVKRGSTPGRLGTTAMRNHLAKHHQREWAATGTANVVTAPSAPSTSRHSYPVATTSQAPPQEQGLPLLRSVLDICYCFFATVCTLCGAVISRGETVNANREYLMLQHMQSAHCSILQVSLNEMQGGIGADDDSSNSSS